MSRRRRAAPPPPPPHYSELLRVPWEGGSTYWSQFQKTNDANWDNATFFPCAVFLGKPDLGHPASLADIGINVYMSAEYNPPVAAHLTELADAGITAMVYPDNPYAHDLTPEANQITTSGWDYSDIVEHAAITGWFLTDEPDMGYGGWPGSGLANNNEDGYLDAVQGLAANAVAHNDGRFRWCNFGNGVLNTFWSPNTLDEMIDEIHGYSVDKYPYTSPAVRFEYGRANDWRADCGITGVGIGSPEEQAANQAAAESYAQSSAAYGWMYRQMRRRFENPDNLKPMWGFVESKMPKLQEAGRTIITYEQIEGAVWSAVANEARGITYFQHNGEYGEAFPGGPVIDPNTGIAPTNETYSLVHGQLGLKDCISAISAQLASLAPVLNTQSYVWDFSVSRMDTMLKVYGGFAYIFASVGVAGTIGSKVFRLPSGIIDNTVEVVGESRTLPLSRNRFTDSFASEHSHHIYKMAVV